ncbi:MAG TPA: thioredoxin family protein [Blastocatellia bacterium]
MKNTVLHVAVLVLVCGLAGGVVLWWISSSTPQPPPTVQLSGSADSERPDIARAVPTTITWQSDLDSAREIAAGQRGIVIVDVYTDWCPWCKKMDQVIYSDRSVAALGAHDVFVKANAEDHGSGQTIAHQFGVDRYPTTLLIDRKGKLLDTIHGFISPTEGFVQLVRKQEEQAR